MEHALQAGFSRCDITPKTPCFLVGYPHVERTSTGTNDPLYSSVVCLTEGTVSLVMISMDWLFVSAEWTAECRRRIHTATGIPENHIMIGATHTHSGPHTAEVLAWRNDPVVPEVDRAYVESAMTETVKATVAAWEQKIPAEAGWTTAGVRGLAGGNRISAQGPEDPEAGLLFVRHADNKNPLAILSVYGMHPTVLHEDSTLFSGDFIAYTRQHLEAAFPGAGVVYLNGVCGNQSPRRVVKAQTFAEAERIGVALGERMAGALKELVAFNRNITLSAVTEKIELEGKHFPSVKEAEASLAAARERYESLKTAGEAHALVRTAECTVFGAEEVYTLAQAEESGDAETLRQRYRETALQAFRVGDVCIAAWPGEFFVEYGLEVKDRAALKTFVCTMANGELQGYVVTPEAEKARGYEAQMSLINASSGLRFVETTIRMVEQLKPGSVL